MKPIKQRHIRWNWEMSPNTKCLCFDIDGVHAVRYHLVVVDDKFREGIMCKIVKPLSEYGNLEIIRSKQGSVIGTSFRYLFESFDTLIKPEMLKLEKLGKLIIKDKDLCERKIGNIEDYIFRIYNN